jgi:hypothetical protein
VVATCQDSTQFESHENLTAPVVADADRDKAER